MPVIDRIIDADLVDRVRASLESLNSGSPDAMLERYAADVVVVTPLFRLGDAGETVVRGKAAFRAYLLGFMRRYRRFDVLDIHPRDKGFFVLIGLGGGVGTVGYGVTFGLDGLVGTVTIYAVD